MLKMSKVKKKYYVVWKGRTPGIYDSWEDCKLQINEFIGAQYKSFESLEEATIAFRKDPKEVLNYGKKEDKPVVSSNNRSKNNIIKNSICVDAACSGNPGDMEYRCVFTISKAEIFHKGPFKDGTNNIGEFLGLVHALAMLDQQKKYDITIYTDSITAISWVKNKKAKTKLERTSRNKELFELLERAQIWLNQNTIKNPILKWETEIWGEIPADFGRK